MGNSLSGIVDSFLYYLYETGELSSKLIRDRHYSFGQLYEDRLVKLELICNCLAGQCCKTKIHFDGTMFNDDFLLIINTLLGPATFHLKGMYYDDFHIEEIPCGPKYDGYTPEDSLIRLDSIVLPSKYYETKEIIPYKPLPVVPSEYSEDLTELINNILKTLRDHGKIDLNSIGDGHHFFELLYRERRLLLKILCQLYPDLAYKSEFDSNGDPIPGDKFLVGIKTPGGEAIQIFGMPRFNGFYLPALPSAPVDVTGIITNDRDQLDQAHKYFNERLLSLKPRNYYE